MKEVSKQRILRVVACMGILVAGCAAFVEQPFELVGEKRAATVVVPANADPSTGLAVTELTNYVCKITGVTLQVASCELQVEGKNSQPSTLNSQPSANCIVIGTLRTLKDVPAEAKAALEKTDNVEAAWTGVKDGTLWIVGKDEVAELYATYHFLESKLGVRWFQAPVPEDPGDYYPTAKTLTLAPFAEFREPKFMIRRLDKCSAVVRKTAEKGKMTAVRNGFQVLPGGEAPNFKDPKSDLYAFFAPRCSRHQLPLGGGHMTFVRPTIPREVFPVHPEYFALVDGKRVCDEQYCFSNPEVQNRTIEYVLKNLDERHGDGSYLFGMVDKTHGWCECDNCRALDPVAANGDSTPNVSTRFGIAVTNMCARIWAKYPQADLRLWAYHTYRELPVGVTYDPRLKVQFCDHSRCYGHRFDDPTCERNVKMLALMKDWLKMSPFVYTYEYYNCSANFYNCHEKDEAHDIRFYASLGVKGWKNEAAFSGSCFWPPAKKGEHDRRADKYPSHWQWLYVAGHLLWDPYQDEDALLDDAESKYYGPAYPAMKKYHALRRKLWANSSVCMGYPWADPRTPTLLNVPGAKEELLGYLDEAEKLAKGDAVRLFRVGRDRFWLNEYWIKPNEALRAKASKSFKPVRTTMPIAIDGKGGEGAWAGAFYAAEFNGCNGPDRKPIPPELATSVGILYDDEALYFLVQAKDPKMANPSDADLGSDGVEFFLFPPAIDNRNYHVAVNLDGTVKAWTHPGKEVPDCFGTTAKVARGKDGWTMEVRVPVAKIHPLKNGETWKVNLARNRMDGKTSRSYSTDGDYFDEPNYRPMEIGATYLRNGSFADLDAKGVPDGWGFNGKKWRVEPSGAGHVVILKGDLYQCMAHGALRQSDKPRKLKYDFTAKGPGKVEVAFFRYVDTRDPKAKNGYTRKMLPGTKGRVFELTDAMARYSGEHTVPAGEWDAIVFRSVDGVTIGSVTVDPVK